MSNIFLSNFYFFNKWQAFKNYEKCFLFHLKRSFRYRDIHIFATLSSYLDNWWRHELKALSSIILESNGQQVEKEGMTEIQKLEYLENEKSSLVEIKRIFNSVWRAIIPWKNKNLMKIANKSFKVAIFSDVILVSNYHGSKEKVINLIPHYLIVFTKL